MTSSLLGVPGPHAQDHPEVVHHRFEAPGAHPALPLLINRGQGGRSFGIIRDDAPVRTSHRIALNTVRKS